MKTKIRESHFSQLFGNS